MWIFSSCLALLLFSSFMIDDIHCPAIRRQPTRKIQSVNSLCHILNYGQVDRSDIRTHPVNDPDEPITLYQTGYKNRVEYVRAVVTVQSVKSKGSTTNENARKFARAMGKPTDDAGHIIGNQLGGSGRALYNIFPQSPNINRGVWSQKEKEIRQIVLTTQQSVEVIVQLDYPSPTSTRPQRFRYRAVYQNNCHSADVINP